MWVANEGVQVHGGMGYVEETGAAQFLRDVRVTAIYEGTNGIQAMDLVGRKMMDGGDAAFRLLDEVQAGAEAARGAEPGMAQAVWNAAEVASRGDRVAAGAGDGRAVRRLRALPARLRARAGRAFPPDGGAGGRRAAAGRSRGSTCAAFCRSMRALLSQVREGAETVLALTPGDLAA